MGQQSFIDRKLRKNSQQKRKRKKMMEKEREKESHEYEKKAQGLEPSGFDHHRLLDVPKRSIRFGESPLKKVPKSLYLSLSPSLSCQKDDANITSKLTDEIFNQISPRAIPPTFLRH